VKYGFGRAKTPQVAEKFEVGGQAHRGKWGGR